MPYRRNPFGSSEGNKIVDEIFDLMFISEDAQANLIEKENLQRQVRYYRGNIINIVNKMRKFVDGYQQVPIAESNSSGIHICPHCSRRDFIYHWETVDGGHYSNPNNWNNSANFSGWILLFIYICSELLISSSGNNISFFFGIKVPQSIFWGRRSSRRA